MINNKILQLQQGLHTAFIDSGTASNLAYRPQFISNNYKEGRKVISSIEDELLACEEFCISVAFITNSGITPLLQTLKELERKNVKGRILTTDYLNFTDPIALKKLANLKNITLKMYSVDGADEGFHTKGYIFQNKEVYRIIVGSSNMTQGALTKNKEWNTKVISTEQGEYAKEIIVEFEQLWNSSKALSFDEFIEQYTVKYNVIQKQKRIARQEEITSLEQYRLNPNSMQLAFISNMNKICNAGEKRALLISATGTGKTYASAFAMREQKVERVLFVVHREQIAKQAMKSYKKVFGSGKKYALLSGNDKDIDAIASADFVFSTMQMMAKPEIYTQFDKAEFPYIIVDEVHRAGAESYQRIMKYFEPRFWLGMTASPDRTDGFDIYNLFDHNIAYEIRLQQALEENLLCPFHYFGITDLEIDGEVFDDNAGTRNFNNLVSDVRVKYIIEKAEYYGYSGERVKGLIFCSRKEEARELSNKFNKYGYYTTFLCGDDSQEVRERAIELLEQDELENRLDYIFTVDIFNEGVDIPQVNQVIMLRPTESPIIFVQQLGRGLRKAENKEHVVIIDFIGNYMNNFMIPMALSGDRTYSKDSIRKYVREGSRVVPGSSTIHFDEISKKRIFESIDKMSTTKKLLTEKYMLLKRKLGRIPSIVEFYEYGEIDPMLFVDYSGSYHEFCQLVDKDYNKQLSDKEVSIIEFVSNYVVNGKRPHELLILKLLLEQGRFTADDIIMLIKQWYQIDTTQETIESAVRVLEGKFINSPGDKKRYAHMELLSSETAYYARMNSFYQRIQHRDFYEQMKDLIELGLRKYQDMYHGLQDDLGLALYQKYSRKDVCRILNWERDDSSTVYGYKIKNGTCPIFVTYEKKEDIASSTKYPDEFINNGLFSWMTRSRVSEESAEAQELIHHKERGLKILLFVKKSDGEGTDFYYMGQVEPVAWKQTVIENDAGKQLPIMNFQMALKQSVREDIFDYFTK